MKKTLSFVLGLLFIYNLSAESLNTAEQEPKNTSVYQSMGYVDFGVGPFPLLVPNFGVGYRLQNNHHGMDAGVEIASIGVLTELKAKLLYLYYFKPDLKSEIYMGLGAGSGAIMPTHKFKRDFFVTLSPELLIGKQYLNNANGKRFFQVEVGFPTFSFSHLIEKKHKMKSDVFYAPIVLLTYGIGF